VCTKTAVSQKLLDILAAPCTLHCCVLAQTDVTTESVTPGDISDDEHSKGLMLSLYYTPERLDRPNNGSTDV